MKASRIAAVALVSSLGGGLVASVAGASFDDVSPEGQFAEHIESVQQAGIATGYNDGTFRPSRALTRQQAAAWLNRAASRTALDFANEADEFQPMSPAEPTQALAEVEMTSPAANIGGGWVTLQGYVASATRNGTGAGCPCAFDVEVTNSSGETVAVSRLTTPGEAGDDERTEHGPVGFAPITGAVFLPGGDTETYTLEITLVDSDVEEVLVAGTLWASYAAIAEGEPSTHPTGPVDDPVTLVPEG